MLRPVRSSARCSTATIVVSLVTLFTSSSSCLFQATNRSTARTQMEQNYRRKVQTSTVNKHNSQLNSKSILTMRIGFNTLWSELCDCIHNKNCVLYTRPWVDEIKFLPCDERWALHVVIKRKFFYIYTYKAIVCPCHRGGCTGGAKAHRCL